MVTEGAQLDERDHSALTGIGRVQEAISRLSEDDLIRLEKAARILLGGTGYSDPQELINEALVRTLSAATGQRAAIGQRRSRFRFSSATP